MEQTSRCGKSMKITVAIMALLTAASWAVTGITIGMMVHSQHTEDTLQSFWTQRNVELSAELATAQACGSLAQGAPSIYKAISKLVPAESSGRSLANYPGLLPKSRQAGLP